MEPDDVTPTTDTGSEVETPAEVIADETPTPTDTPNPTGVDFESTIAELTNGITERDARIADLSSQLTTAQQVNSSLLRQIGTTVAPDAHDTVERTNITINELLYGRDDD